MNNSFGSLVLLPLLLVMGAARTAAAVPDGEVSPPSPSVLRHYTFSAARDAATPIAGGGSDGALRFEPGQNAQDFETVPGRRPGDKAVRLDQGSLTGPPFPIGHAFTVELWCRSQGQGRMRGNSGATNGTLIAAGTGYWDGWRLTVNNPTGTVGFEIGRPQPSSSVGITGGALATGAWQHVTASWDGREMRLYLNGLLVAHGPYDGVYTPPAGPMRLGYADSGIGSLRLDVDEVTAYNGAVDSATILEQAHTAPLATPLRNSFRRALEAREGGDVRGAATAFRRLVQQSGLAPAYRASARLGLAEALEGSGTPAQAAGQYAALVEQAGTPEAERGAALTALLNLIAQGAAGDLAPHTFAHLMAMPGIPPAQRIAALFGFARSLRRAHSPRSAAAQYDRLLATPGLLPGDRWNAALGRVHTLCEGDDWAAAHTAAVRLAHASGVPGSVGSLALLAVAHSAVAAGKYALAGAVFREVTALRGAPPHHAWEARQGLQEAARMQAGKPAVDPEWGRGPLPPEPKPARRFYVAPGGSDANPGTLSHPFATLAHARDALRAMRQKQGLPHGEVAVVLRGGEYPLTETFSLSPQDSGSAGSPIVYTAADGETPVLTGATRLHGFGPVRDPALLARLPASARGKVVQVDLRANGITDFGRLQPHGYGRDAVPVAEVFFNGRPLTPARWPNSGFVRTGPVVDAGSEQGPGGFEFMYQGDEPARWVSAPDAWLYGYWYWDWADSTVGIASIDPARHRLRTTSVPPMGVRAGQRFYAFNVLAELDAPGEWYLDRTRGLLLFYPPGKLAGATVQFSRLNSPLITLQDVSHVTVRRLMLEGGRATGVSLVNSSHCRLAACTVRRCGGDGVIVTGGTDDGVLGCDLYTLGRGGVRVSGGERKTLTPARHFVENCDIHDFSRLDRTYTPAVWLDGVGIRIAHNRMHDAPHHAIRLEGNDHVIEFNEVDHVVREADDQGGLDIWRDPTYRGNVLRYNYWHDIGSGLKAVGQAGVRLDDAISGTLIYGNIFQRCSGGNFGGVQINGGRDNLIDNNLFVDCPIAVSGGPWDPGHWTQFLAGPDGVSLTTQVVDIQRPPYSTRYPALAHLGDAYAVNYIWRNIVVNSRQFVSGDPSRQEQADNDLAGSVTTSLSAAAALPARDGFAPIPLGQIGLYRDGNRASWPTKNRQILKTGTLP